MGVREGYKRTDAGLVPEPWEVRQLKDIANIRTGPFGTLLKAHEYSSSDGVPMISVGEVGEGEFRVHGGTPLIPPEVVRRLPEYVLNEGDIVLGRKGAVDRSAVVRPSQSGWFLGSDGIRVRLSRDCYAPFVGWQFQRAETRAWLLQNATGTTMPSMNQEILRRVAIALPPLPEQRAIAAALGDVDALLAGLDKLIAKKRDLKQAAMQRLLTGETRLPGFDGKWVPAALSAISAFITKGSTPTTYGFGWKSDGVLFLRSECVSEQGLDLAESMRISEAGHAFLRRSEVVGGDILMTITGNVGRVVLLPDKFQSANINQHIARVRVTSTEVSREFVYHYLSQRTVRQRFGLITTGQAYPQISLRQVRDAVVPLPSFPEQRGIAELLSSLDAEIAALEARRNKTRAVKQGMMQELLTGRTRLI